MPVPLRQCLVEVWTKILGLNEITPGDNFFSLGGDSLNATAMCLEVEKQTGSAIPVGQIYLTPILEAFAAAIENLNPDEKAPLFIPMNPGGAQRPLFAIAPAMGGVFHFQELGQALSPDQPLFVIEPRISPSGEHNYSSLEDLAWSCLKILRTKQPQGPYRLAGYSFGGILAWEMACLLEAQLEVVDGLFLLDASSRSGYQSTSPEFGYFTRLRHKWDFLQNCRQVRRVYGQRIRLSRCVPLLTRKMRHSMVRHNQPQSPVSEVSRNIGQRNAAAMHVPAQAEMKRHYKPRTFHGKTVLFRSKEQLTLHRELDYDLGWGRYSPEEGPNLIEVQGDHFSLLKEPHVSGLGKAIRQQLARADKQILQQIKTESREVADSPSLAFPEPGQECDLSNRYNSVVSAFPDKVAIRDGGVRLTYGEFDTYCRQVAAFVVEQDPHGRDPILLHFQSCWQYVCVVFGILLTGRSYVPVDTDYPAERIRKIISLSGARLAISLQSDHLGRQLGDTLKIVAFSRVIQLGRRPGKALPSCDPKAPAVYLFTSGSSGEPKGAILSRRMILHQSWRRQDRIGVSSKDRYAMLYVSPFMGAVNVLYTTILSGASLHVYNLRSRGFAELGNWLLEEKVTILHMITSLLRRFMDTWEGTPALPDVRLIIPGGERSRPSDLLRWKETFSSHSRFCGCLGSTEAGTLTLNPLSFTYEHPGGPIPIGKPIPSLGVCILGTEGQSLPPGKVGQIVVESHYIFDGYLNEEANRAANFYRLPDGRAHYETGDFGYLNEEGVLFNLGRRDNRVKINGTLVELEEVESVLIASKYAGDAAVLLRPLRPGSADPVLVAFYKPVHGEHPDLRQKMTQCLLDQVPKSMIPRVWIELPQFPQTTNGKTDRKALESMSLDNHLKDAASAP